jgi:hypothetical protein
MEIVGWAGTALVIVAYYPEIHHLSVEKCAWGIGALSWLIWLASSALLLTRSILREDLLMGFVQGVGTLATASSPVVSALRVEFVPLSFQDRRLQPLGHPSAPSAAGG